VEQFATMKIARLVTADAPVIIAPETSENRQRYLKFFSLET
jgi:hypothetical protein